MTIHLYHLVERLRKMAGRQGDDLSVCAEAADEIERAAQMGAAYLDALIVIDTYRAALREIERLDPHDTTQRIRDITRAALNPPAPTPRALLAADPALRDFVSDTPYSEPNDGWGADKMGPWDARYSGSAKEIEDHTIERCAQVARERAEIFRGKTETFSAAYLVNECEDIAAEIGALKEKPVVTCLDIKMATQAAVNVTIERCAQEIDKRVKLWKTILTDLDKGEEYAEAIAEELESAAVSIRTLKNQP